MACKARVEFEGARDTRPSSLAGCGHGARRIGIEDTSAGRRGYAERMRRRAIEERQAGNKESEAAAELRRGWCLGGAGFRERMLRLLDAAGEKLLKPRRSRFDARVEHDHWKSHAGSWRSACAALA